ncbi:hypothetical protein Vau01_110090 [Virgisporangium aurantiacum]|uniref:WD domain-containing protein, G-beta repeat-containing protein n=1 Tax=Virgisporangium aurantiacum TaxID=175570 RepID=A0A8J4E6T8_9ACTN|nr:hypothetical protein [Virgisporangium aurantiacum]GIJ63493.1 hypothetical protein Vau01_110090 [Virgisporangium aurantiacum]
MAWSPDGGSIAAGAYRTLRVWDLDVPAPAPIPVATVRGHEAIVKTVAWSPDSTLIATADVENNVHLWRAADTAAPVRSLAGPAGWAVAWSPDGRTLATGSPDGPLRLWDAATGQLTATLGAGVTTP